MKGEEEWELFLASYRWRAHEHRHHEQEKMLFRGSTVRYCGTFLWQYIRHRSHDRAPLEIDAENSAVAAVAARNLRENEEAPQVSCLQMSHETGLMMGLRPLKSEREIQTRIDELARDIRATYGDRPVLLVAVLKGSFVFVADLCRRLGENVSVDFIQVSSYGLETRSSGIVQIRKDLDQSIEGKDVLIVEDIVDTGATLAHLRELLETRKPNSLRVVSLLSKPEARTTPCAIEFLGFEIGNEFVVGYGLDHAEKYRNLPYVAILDETRPS
jgi:hypoxanthine phosphoribosyltransferase